MKPDPNRYDRQSYPLTVRKPGTGKAARLSIALVFTLVAVGWVAAQVPPPLSYIVHLDALWPIGPELGVPLLGGRRDMAGAGE
jgi:hypothetical protein